MSLQKDQFEMKSSIWFGILLLSCSLAFGISFEDDFNDTEIDATLWQVRLPFVDSTVVEHDGIARIRHGGQLITKEVFDFPYEVTGRLRIAGNPRDTLVLNFRSDGLSDPAISPNELINSLQIRFTKVTDPGSLVNWVIAQDWTDGSLGLATYPYEIGQWYQFKFRDDGLNFQFFFDDLNQPLISGISTQPNGGKFAVLNRPGSAGGSSISEGSVIEFDFIRIQSVPDSEASLPLLAFGFCALAGLARIAPSVRHPRSSLSYREFPLAAVSRKFVAASR